MKLLKKLLVTLCLVAVTLSASINENIVGNSVGNNQLQKSHRNERLLFFIKILPEQCQTGIDGTPLGTCREFKSCKKISGTSTTRCAKGLGTCCLDTVSCGGSTSRNNTYFVSPNFPSAWASGGTCQLTVNRANSNICQIRIDFISFILAQPDIEGQCMIDMMSVTGGSTVPILCGHNTGQHIYVDVDPSGSPLRIRVDADTNVQTPRIFSMQITQIPCTSRARAPTGCLQYFQLSSGNVKSFNFPLTATGAQTNIRAPDTNQLSSTDYGVCVRPEEGFCSIEWRPDSDFEPFNFFVSGDQNVLQNNNLFDNIATVTAVAAMCQNDYVIIPSAQYTNFTGFQVTADRFCGPSFPPTATSELRPFNMYVHTDDSETLTGDEGNIGFSLNFRQRIC